MKRVLLFSVIITFVISLSACRNSTYNNDNSYVKASVGTDSNESKSTNKQDDSFISKREQTTKNHTDVSSDISVITKQKEMQKGNVIASGDCGENGDNVKWKLYDEGLLVIEGSGKMKDHPYPTVDRSSVGGGWGQSERLIPLTPWKDYNKTIKSVVISDGITKVADGSFSGTCIEYLSLGDSVEAINRDTLEGCDKLTSLRIPKGIKSLGEKGDYYDSFIVLYESSDLESIEVDDDNEYFCSVNGVLYNKDKTELLLCPPKNKKEIVDLPNSVKKIRSRAFCGCKNLVKINMPVYMEEIGKYAFSRCTNLLSVDIPQGIKSISDCSFDSCTNLKDITIPNSVNYIGIDSFYKCKNLTIKCGSGSYAEKYAKDNKIKYEVIG